jgi:hypothetical protein
LQAAGVSVAVTTFVPETGTTCGGDSVYEQGAGRGSALATLAVPATVRATDAASIVSDLIIPGC